MTINQLIAELQRLKEEGLDGEALVQFKDKDGDFHSIYLKPLFKKDTKFKYDYLEVEC